MRLAEADLKLPENAAEVAGAGESAASQLAALRDLADRRGEELSEKDDIIQALTGKLEQVAEQLDRVKRSGADRGPRSAPPEPAAGHTLAVDGVQTLLGHFEGVDLGGSLSRLEAVLSEVREVVVSQRSPAEERVDSATPSQAASTDLLGGWDAIRSQFMADGDAPHAECVSEDAATDDATATEACEQPADVDCEAVTGGDGCEPKTADRAIAVPVEPPPVDPLPHGLPEPFDYAAASHEDLVEAIESRDRYITLLSRRASDRRAKLTVPTDWSQLSGAGEDLVDAVRRLHEELDDAVRTAEVDLCLERARLSRERTRLADLETSCVPQSDAAESETQPRWRRVLGITGD